MGVKYFARYKDVEGVIKEIRFSKDDFSGTPTEWFCTSGAVDFNAGASDNFFPDQPIIASQARISLFLNEHYDLSEFAVNRRTFFVEIVNTNTNQTKWSGWVEPWDAARAYKKAPWEMNLTASCGLAHLSRKKYTSSNSDFRKTGLEIVQECLQIIGSSLNVVVSTHMKENSFPGDAVLGLNSYEQDITRFFDSNGEAMYCNVIVNDILNHFNAEIVQDNNRWVIRGIVDHATGLATSQHEIGGNPSAGSLPGTYEVNSFQSFTEDGGQVRILAPINKYRTEVDLGAQRPFFDNGNMLIWNEDGLVGWDFTHMPKGNPGWERYEIGGEVSRGVLKVNGKAPQPYRKRKKTSLFKKLTNQAINIAIAGTGAVGALFNKPVLKGAWEDIEPSEWIESPGGTISKADASVTISFDYETEAFSSDVLISIRIPVNTPKGVKNFWVDPTSEPALAGADKSAKSLDDKYHLIRIPPVDRGKLVNRGDINVASNPNYPAANVAGWTWTVTGVPNGEFRKIGGENGVIVENGDLIIARVANTGGSQEATGNNWEVISIRNNIKRGNYSIKVSLNTTFITKPGEPFPADKIYVRFYKMADDEGLPGDWYKVYNLKGQLEGFVPSEDSAQYATTLERGGVTDEEAATIQLISGDYNPYYVGGWTKPGTNDPTKSWCRRPAFPEGISIYRAMMKDRLSMTTRSVIVIEGNIKLMPGAPELSYLHTLVFGDQGGRRFRIVRFRYNEVRRIANVKAIEVRYEEIPNSELRQDSYIPGKRQLNTVPGEGDGIYPSKEDSTTGRMNAEDLPLTDDELLEVLEEGSRMGVLFDEIDPLIFEIGTQSTKYRDLADYLSEVFLENEDEFEDEDTTDFGALEFSVVSKPAWVTNVTKDELIFGVSGKPTAIGEFSLQIGLFDPEEPELIVPVTIPIIVYPKTTIKYTLRDTSGLEPLGVGEITNGSGFLKPDTWDILVQVKGHHEGWYAKLTGMGINLTPTPDPYALTTSTDEATYILGSNIDSEVGIYNLIFATYRDEGEPDNLKRVKQDKIRFTLYDETYLGKARFELWNAVSNTQIGPINPNGSSAFNVEEAWDVKMIVDGVEHDAGTSVLGSEVGDLDTLTIGPLDPTVEDASYFQLGEPHPEFDPSTYNVLLTLTLEGEEQYVRAASFTINKDKVKPVGGKLQLVSMVPNTTNYDVMGVLAINGNLFTLPSNSWNVLLESDVPAGTTRTHQLFQKKGDSLVAINTAIHTGKSQTKTYSVLTEEDLYFIFEGKGSKDIGKIHLNNTSFRVIITDEVDGEVSNIYQADFSFGTLEGLDDLDISEPGNSGEGVQEYYAGRGLSEIVDDYIKTFNANVDNETLEVFDQTNPLVNWLRVKEGGIKHVHYQDIATLSILGNLSGASGSPYEVPVITSTTLSGASNLNLATSLAVKTYVDTKFTSTVSGTIGRYSKFATTNTLNAGILGESGINVTANSGQFASAIAPNVNARGLVLAIADSTPRWTIGKAGLEPSDGTGSDFVIWRFNDAGTFMGASMTISRSTGLTTLPGTLTIQGGGVVINTSSTTLNPNFNADYLDGQHGPYYLDRANHTGTQLANTISNFSTAVLATTLTGLSTSNSTITSSDTILQAFGKLQGQVTVVGGHVGAGTINYFPYYNTSTTLATSPLSISGINITANGTQFVADTSANSNVRGLYLTTAGLNRWAIGKAGLETGSDAGSDFTLWRFSDGNSFLGEPLRISRATGATTLSTQLTIQGSSAPLVVSSSLLVTNFNSDYLDGQHGSYYLDWNNFTNVKSVLAGNGLTGGGSLTSNVTLTLGTPSTITNATINSVSGTTHTHAIQVSDLIAGTNVSLSASGAGVILGPNSITISVGSVPWNTGVSGKPTTLSGFGIVDAPTIDTMNLALSGKENTFSKGNLAQGTGISMSGTLTGRLYDSGTVTIGLATSGISAGTYTSVTVDTYGRVTAGSNPGSGISGTAGYIAQFGSGGTTVVNSVIRDTGSEINIADTRSFGVEGPAAMRDYLHVWGYANFGTSSNHGTILIHQANSGTIDGAAALEIRSTTKGFLLPKMTSAQMFAIPSPPVGLMVFQTDIGTSGIGAYMHYGGGEWYRHKPDF